MKADFKKHWPSFVVLGKIRTYVDKYASYDKEAQCIHYQIRKKGKWNKAVMGVSEIKRVFLELYPSEGHSLVY